MQRVTPTDRDRAVRKLSAVTGGITVASMALTGGVMILAKQETDARKATKARQASARLSLAGQNSLVGGTGAGHGSQAGPTVHVYTTAAPVTQVAKPVPTSTSSAAPTRTSATHKPVVVRAEPKAKTVRPASGGTASRTTSLKVTTSKATTPTAAKVKVKAPTATKTSKPKPTDTPAPDPKPSDTPDPVQSSGS